MNPKKQAPQMNDIPLMVPWEMVIEAITGTHPSQAVPSDPPKGVRVPIYRLVGDIARGVRVEEVFESEHEALARRMEVEAEIGDGTKARWRIEKHERPMY